MATKVCYGITNTITKDFPEDMTIGDLLSDTATLGFLSAPEGCAAISGGETLDESDYVFEYATISLDKKAAKKA